MNTDLLPTQNYHVYMAGDEKAENLSHKDLKIDFNAAMLLDLLDFDRKGQRYDHNDFLNLYYADSDEFTAKLMNYNHKLIAKFGRNRYDEYFEQHKQQSTTADIKSFRLWERTMNEKIKYSI